MTQKIACLLGLLCCLSANMWAQPTTTPQPTQAEMAAEAAAFNAIVEAQNGRLLPSITNEKMQYLFQKISGIDYIFYGADFSVSADETNSRSNLAYISVRNAKMLEGKKPVGRVFWAAEGNIALEAEVYWGDTQIEQYFVFLEQSKPVAANYITPAGVAFFKQVVNARVEATPKNADAPAKH